MKKLRKKRVLIIEDEPSILKLLAESFKQSGFKISLAPSAEKGLELFRKNRPDLILLDIILPKMDGLTMLKILRQSPGGHGIPVIVLSNINDHKIISEALRIGVYDFLIKSDVNFTRVVEQVKEVLY